MAGSNAVVLGRSKIVGTPVSELLKWHNATVTICHSRTKEIENQVKTTTLNLQLYWASLNDIKLKLKSTMYIDVHKV